MQLSPFGTKIFTGKLIPQTAVRSCIDGRSISSDFLPGLFLPLFPARIPFGSPHPSNRAQTDRPRFEGQPIFAGNFSPSFAPPSGLDFLFLERPRCQHISNNTRACHSRLVGVPTEGNRGRLCAARLNHLRRGVEGT